LVEQARPGAVLEHRVFAGAQPEHPLQKLDALTDRMGVRERAEIAVLAVLRAAMESQPRKPMSGDREVRVGLVVAEEDVVARRKALDQVVLEEQRFTLRASDR